VSENEKILRVGLTTPVTWLSPRQASDASSHMVLAQVFEAPYIQAARESTPEPALMATLLEQDSGGPKPVYSAAIRPGLEFSDGTPVTADHVVASLLEVGSLAASATVSRRGDRVVFSLARPIPNFEFQLSKRWCTIVLERAGRLYGTGAFMLAGEAPEPGQPLRLIKNPRHRDPVALDGIEFRVYPPSADGRHDALVAAIESGEVHLTSALPRDEVGRLENVRKLFQPGNSTAMLYFNTERGPLAELEARRVLAHALDRYQLARVCYPDSPGLAARGLLPPNMGSVHDGIRSDPRGAKEKLESGDVSLPSKLRTVMVWGPRPYVPKPTLVIEEINRQLQELGVELDPISTTDPEDYFAKLRDGEYDVVLGGWIADTEDPVDFLDAVLTTEFIPIPGRPTAVTANLSRWDDAKTNELVARYRESASQADLDEIMTHVAEQVPLLPVLHGPRVVVHTRDVKNFDPTPTYVPSLAKIDLD
jgi:ABC-type transport system substrate-binding protein